VLRSARRGRCCLGFRGQEVEWGMPDVVEEVREESEDEDCEEEESR
jgi:hypothetical protein